MDTLKSDVLALVANQNEMTLATISEKNLPQAATVFYVNRNFEFFFFSSSRSRHAKNIDRSPWAAATISNGCNCWTDIKGVQMEGKVTQIHSSIEKGKVVNMFSSKFPFIKGFIKEKGKMLSIIKESNIYLFKVDVLYYTDNKYGFGQRRELVLE
ncbi:uncharacterized protein YhbP (UPF0306 family) [Desulfitispora alkaliphila]|uniref:pyridoxamine 5'-phosphate oxidase family protein n=1 Tax=Desulfitispora alkaliphila TaxID=622674 RepID=UPI003D1C6B34